MILSVCTCLGISPRSTAQQQTEENPELVALCEELVRICDSQNRAGGVVVVKRAGHTELVRAFQKSPDKIDEQAGFEPQGFSIKPDSILRIGFMSTTITSVAALTFVEEGTLSLKDPLAKYLPEFANPVVGRWDAVGLQGTRPATQEILIEHLLTQTSGVIGSPQDAIPAGIRYEPPAGQTHGRMCRLESTRDLVRRIAQLPLMFDPGYQWHLGHSADVLGAVLEEITGQTLSKILDDRIFTPLGMKDTAFIVPPEKLERVPPYYVRGYLGSNTPVLLRLPRVEDIAGNWATFPPTLCLGATGLDSTAGDCVRFCEMLLGGGQRDGVRILSEEILRDALTDRVSGLPRRSSFGQGGLRLRGGGFGLGFLLVTEENASPSLGAAGTFYSVGTEDLGFLVDPDQELIAVLLNAIASDSPQSEVSLWPTFRRGVFRVFPPCTFR